MPQLPKVTAGREEDDARQRHAKPSKHGIRRLDDAVKDEPLDAAYGYVRSSTRTRKENVKHQRLGLARRTTELGVSLLHVFGERLESGKTMDHDNRSQLYKALQTCRQDGKPLVVACFSRLLRHPDFGPISRPYLRPTVQQLKALAALAHGVRIYTLNDPDASPEEDKQFLAEIGKEGSGKRGGRPRKGRLDVRSRNERRLRRQRWEGRVLELHQHGRSGHRILEDVLAEGGPRIDLSTICRWIREANQD